MNLQKNYRFGNHTDIGKVRQQNEDYMGYFTNQNGDFFVVCDGMGGHVGGAVASQTAVTSIRAFFDKQYYDSPQDAIYQAIQYANSQIYNKATANTSLSGMGTTCVILMLRDSKLYYGHVGDSRLYAFKFGQMQRLTKDHSFVQALVEQGLISEEEAEVHPRRNELLRALGTGAYIEPDVAKEPVLPFKNDHFLLCSDGLTGLVSDEGMAQVLKEAISEQEKALKLVEMANAMGGYDNITVQVIRFMQDKPTASTYESSTQNFAEEQDFLPEEPSSNFVPPHKTRRVRKQKVEDLESDIIFKDSSRRNPFISKSIGEFNYSSLLVRGAIITGVLLVLYFVYAQTLGQYEVFGTTFDKEKDKQIALNFENKMYQYFWNISTIKNVTNTYQNTKQKMRAINESVRNIDEKVKQLQNLFTKVEKLRNPLKNTQERLSDLAQKYNSNTQWILDANGVSSEEELKNKDEIIIPSGEVKDSTSIQRQENL